MNHGRDKMKLRRTILAVIIILFILSFTKIIIAEENEYGICNAWFKLENEEWQKTPIENISLDIYQPFYIKAEMLNKIKCWPSFRLTGVGNTETFEVIEGPSEFSKSYYYHDQVEEGWSETHIWKIRPTDNKFVGGYTPLKLNVQFEIKELNEHTGDVEYLSELIEMHLVYPFINENIWSGYQEDESNLNSENNSNQNENKTPGFELILLILSLILIFYLNKRKYI